jgi:hypothetical protein
MVILGRQGFSSKSAVKAATSSSCSFLEENTTKGSNFNLIATFHNFKKGIAQIIRYSNIPQMKDIL